MKSKWSHLVLGVAMLNIAAFVAFVCLGNKIGFGEAFGLIVLASFIAAWIIIGLVFLLKGLGG